MKFQVRCLRVAQFTLLQSVLRKNRKTIIGLTIICHSISVFLANVWKNVEEIPRNPEIFDLLSKLVFILD